MASFTKTTQKRLPITATSTDSNRNHKQTCCCATVHKCHAKTQNTMNHKKDKLANNAQLHKKPKKQQKQCK